MKQAPYIKAITTVSVPFPKCNHMPVCMPQGSPPSQCTTLRTFAAVCSCLLDHRLTDEAIDCSSVRSLAVNQRGKNQTDGEDSTDQTGKVSVSIIGAASPKASQLKGVRRDKLGCIGL